MKKSTLFLIGLLACSRCLATLSIEMDPTYLIFQPGQPIGSITVKNNGTSEGTFDMKMSRYIQKGDKDEFVKADSRLLVTPPIFTTKPNQDQILRVASLGIPPGKIEKYYYIMAKQINVKEIDSSGKNKDKKTSGKINVLLHIRVPVLIEPISIVRTGAASFNVIDKHQVKITFHKSGTVHCQIATLQLTSKNNKVISSNFQKLILPQVTRNWTITLPKGVEASDIKSLALKSTLASGDKTYLAKLR